MDEPVPERLTRRQRIDTAIHQLTGLMQGIALDGELNAEEIAELLNWCDDHRDLKDRTPFVEIIPALNRAMADRQIDPSEKDDLLWLCGNLSPEGEFYDRITHEIQVLHGMMQGILADDVITETEARGLQDWLNDRDFLKGTYPYDELESLLHSVMADGVIDTDEHRLLVSFFEDFSQHSMAKKVAKESSRVKDGIPKEFTLPGVCAMDPEIVFTGKAFTFTGSSLRGKRKDIAKRVIERGGDFEENVTEKTEFLVVGSGGNPAWAFACYGRKIERAVKRRKAGQSIIIVHESDFWDALED